MSKRAAPRDTAAQSKKYKSAIDESISEFLCPITQELPVDPVTAEDGKIYEKSAIVEWLSRQSRSPHTNKPMGKTLTPALQVKNMLRSMIKSGAVQGEKAERWNKRLEEDEEVEETKRRAANGDVGAATELAAWYSMGTMGLEVDKGLSHKYSRISADAGDTYGLSGVGLDYLYGNGTEKCTVRGVHFLTRAADAGCERSCYLLGTFFAHGINGVPKDAGLARRYFEKMPTCQFKTQSEKKEEWRQTAVDWLRDNSV